MEEEKTCASCGNPFVPYNKSDICCSAICRAMYRAKMLDAERKQKEASQKAKLDAMKRPPAFDLKHFPRDRVKWFMSLSEEYKGKFYKFLTPQELEWAREMAQKDLADEKFFSGFYVKNGKIIEPKDTSDRDDDNRDADDAEEGNDN